MLPDGPRVILHLSLAVTRAQSLFGSSHLAYKQSRWFLQWVRQISFLIPPDLGMGSGRRAQVMVKFSSIIFAGSLALAEKNLYFTMSQYFSFIVSSANWVLRPNIFLIQAHQSTMVFTERRETS